MNGFSHRLERVEESMSELEDINREFIQNTAQRDQETKCKNKMLSDMEDRKGKSNTHVIRVL